ncbi:MAG: biopolymer transport protein ExbD [Puniceicoccaceae bacterium 5H]|nr:MAG: biopolymer transport protein ExbD [Puniceicoccaceae bacterium 5H]
MAVDFTSQPAKGPHIEMTPLIDVVFQLLVFFMLTSVFAPPAIELTLPQLESQPSEAKPQLVLNLDAQGHVFLNDEPVAEAELVERLQAALAEQEDHSVYFRGDKDAAYQRVLHLMQLSTEAGADRFQFIYEPEP